MIIFEKFKIEGIIFSLRCNVIIDIRSSSMVLWLWTWFWEIDCLGLILIIFYYLLVFRVFESYLNFLEFSCIICKI